MLVTYSLEEVHNKTKKKKRMHSRVPTILRLAWDHYVRFINLPVTRDCVEGGGGGYDSNPFDSHLLGGYLLFAFLCSRFVFSTAYNACINKVQNDKRKCHGLQRSRKVSKRGTFMQ